MLNNRNLGRRSEDNSKSKTELPAAANIGASNSHGWKQDSATFLYHAGQAYRNLYRTAAAPQESSILVN